MTNALPLELRVPEKATKKTNTCKILGILYVLSNEDVCGQIMSNDIRATFAKFKSKSIHLMTVEFQFLS